MAKPQKPENQNNPLQQLRHLMGEAGKGTRRWTQNQLASATGIPVSTIRGIEAGQRRLTPAILRKVEHTTSASWDEKKERWIFRSLIWKQGAILTDVSPATADGIQAYRKMMEQSAAMGADRDRDAVKMRIDELFTQIRPRHWMHLLFSMQDSLEQLREEFAKKFKNRKAVDLAFAASANRSYLHDLNAHELRKYRKRMASQYADQTKHVRSDGAIGFSNPKSNP
jgi:transcriptional regulator with XRE-family HTH domain